MQIPSSHRWVTVMLLILVTVPIANGDERDKAARFPLLDNGDALKRISHRQPSLPAWARMLAGPMPRTTAEMLKLDYVHRAKNPLNAALRAKIRWAAADAIGCEYSRQVAKADLRRAGVGRTNLKQFIQSGKSASADERIAIAMARKLTAAGHSVTDEEMADLIKRYGPKTVMAIVHTVAHANFQDRIFLALGVQVKADGPYPPLDISTKPGKDSAKRPPRKSWKEVQAGNKDKSKRRPGWKETSFAELKTALKEQGKRQSRISLPKDDKNKGKKKPSRSGIAWNNVSMAYQPELTRAWFRCMNTFYREAELDRVFANSMFWVVTRSNECFY